MKAWLVIGALFVSSAAIAAPKGKAAKAAFDRGVVAYQKGDYAKASDALAQSYKLEKDMETLFAWAQSERQQDKCESAVDLYNQLLAMDMPAENKAVVQTKLEECKSIIAAKTGTTTKPIDEPIEKDPPAVVEEPRQLEEPPEQPEGRTPWWKDPIGDALTISGVIGLGIGGYFLYSAKQAEDRSFESDVNFRKEQDDAESKGRIGMIVTIGGGVLIVAGIVRYATRGGGKTESANVSGWVTPDGGGGISAFGRF